MPKKIKVPEPKIVGNTFICPDCDKEFPTKPGFTLHYLRKHTHKDFNRPKKKYKYNKKNDGDVVIKRKYQKKEIPARWIVNYCPCCGTSLNAVNMALNIAAKHEETK